MTKDSQLTVTCPDCGCEIVVDIATGQVLLHETAAGEPAGGKDFEQLLAGLDESKKRANEVFEREVSALEDRDRLMEEKFRAAMKRAREDPDDEPPLRPWNLD